MGKFDDLLSDIQPPANAPAAGSGRFNDLLADITPKPNANPVIKQDYPFRRNIVSPLVHAAIEGGGMTLAGAASAPFVGAETLGAGPVAIAASAYPPLHKLANAIDEKMGVARTPIPPKPATTQVDVPGVGPVGPKIQIPSDVAETLRDVGTGAETEAAGRVLPVAAGAVADIPFSKFGSAFSGTPASNLSRAFKKGLKTYIAKPLDEARANYGTEESRVMMEHLTPEEQAQMVTDSGGFARNKLNDVLTRWLKGNPISVKDAVQAKQALGVIFPSDTQKNSVLRGKMAQFGDELNQIIASQDPKMAGTIKDYADSSLRSQLLQPLRVNKLNPNEPSKLGIMLATEGVAHTDNPFEAAVKVFTAQSPAFHGFIASVAGQISKIIPNLAPQAQQALARGLYTAYKSNDGAGPKK